MKANFYLLIADFSLYNKIANYNLENAGKLAGNVICLPIYPDLEIRDAERVVHVFKSLSDMDEQRVALTAL